MPKSQPTSFKSTCSYCGVGCGIVVNKDRNGKISVQGDPDHPVNKGKLCSKGMNLNYVVEDKNDQNQQFRLLELSVCDRHNFIQPKL